MKQILRYSLVALFALICNAGFADEATFDWSSIKTTTTAKEAHSYTQGQITLTFDKGTNSYGNIPSENKDGSIRMYVNTSLNIKAADGYVVTKVVFTPTGNSYNATKLTYNGTALTSDEWTVPSPAQSIDLVATANARFKTIVVSYAKSGDTPFYAAPTISGETSFSESTTVTLAAGDGATIYYTTNGQDPDGREGTEYKAPFTLTESATVKAIAYYGNNASAVTSKDFKKAQKYTVAEAVAILTAGKETKDNVAVTGIISQIDEVNAQYGNATYYISDDGTTNGQLQVYRGRSLNNAKFTAEDEIKVGDKVKLLGVLTNYENKKAGTTTQEITNSHIVELTKGAVTDINSAKISAEDENTPVYNLAGQRVSRSYKGVVIKNGKKVLQ